MATLQAVREPTPDERLFSVQRLGIIMEPSVTDVFETEGVTNPACVRGPDGELYLFPRLIARGNYSRIGIARVRFDDDGNPAGVERLGLALEPSESFEKNPFSGGGCEDPRITLVEPFGQYVMTYTAFSAKGPRIALASSRDLITWERHGLVRFSPTGPIDFNATDNKDSVVFPTILADPRDNAPSIALIHRPVFPSQEWRPMEELRAHAKLAQPAEKPRSAAEAQAHRVRLHHQSVWISYCNRPKRLGHLVDLHSHHRLMSPREWWERSKVGAGTPPILTRLGWLIIYHGVTAHEGPQRYFRYSAGIVLLDPDRP